ncbi:hypothetical protein BT96DRAFT_915856 [Gymnopus androsaceus JB14]|uniref:Glycan binding protein Y3-like domain-containing protein n=1 Tax=Gymnopus androsaceus JB14 TaxID=1447944 RepID=A0A6A4IA19_9AGAR|nr:hypothetical protein BT96DRAFT_915856 [Gymnopus androsaceus JB14]
MLYKYRSLSTLIALSLFVKVSFGQSITVNCLSSGQEGDCTSFIPAFCNSIASSGNATILPFDNIARCFNTPDFEFKCDFTAWNNLPAPNGNVPNGVNCEATMQLISELCPAGGNGQVVGANFLFTLDPNAGECTQNEANGNPS